VSIAQSFVAEFGIYAGCRPRWRAALAFA